MKYLVIMIDFFFLISSNGVLQAQWFQTNGPKSEAVTCFAKSGNYMFAGTDHGVCLSTDNGYNWENIGNGLIDTINSQINRYVNALCVNGTNIFAGTSDGVFRSTNLGLDWLHVEKNNLFVQALYSRGLYTLAGTANGGVYISTDNGNNWTKEDNELKSIRIFAFTDIGTNILAGGDKGVYISTNNGMNWTNICSNINVVFRSLAVSGTNVFADGGNEVYFSSDSGTNWTITSINAAGPYSEVDVLAVSGDFIIAGIFSGDIFISNNYGKTWIQSNHGLPSSFLCFSLTINGNDIFLGTYNYGIWRRSLLNEIKDIPQGFALFQNYPNPFNSGTIISYSLPLVSNVKLIVYNTLGQSIKTLENEFKNAGNYYINFNASDFPSGIYFYKLEAGQFSQVKKMILIK